MIKELKELTAPIPEQTIAGFREVLTRVEPKEQPTPHKTFGPGDYIPMGDRLYSWEKMMSE